MESSMKKVVAPQKTKDGKTFWNTIGVCGVSKGGRLWIRLNMVPTNWDGYAMAVEMRETASARVAAEGPHAGEGGVEEQGSYNPETEGPGF